MQKPQARRSSCVALLTSVTPNAAVSSQPPACPGSKRPLGCPLQSPHTTHCSLAREHQEPLTRAVSERAWV